MAALQAVSVRELPIGAESAGPAQFGLSTAAQVSVAINYLFAKLSSSFAIKTVRSLLVMHCSSLLGLSLLLGFKSGQAQLLGNFVR